METIPLVLEPESAMYTSPIVVLDFQSLYPSMMIAYNLCYSTCLGVLPGFRRNAVRRAVLIIFRVMKIPTDGKEIGCN